MKIPEKQCKKVLGEGEKYPEVNCLPAPLPP